MITNKLTWAIDLPISTADKESVSDNGETGMLIR